MADIAITPQRISSSGIEPTYLTGASTPGLTENASDWNAVPNDGKTFLYIKNAHASDARTLTVNTPVVMDGLDLSERTVSVNGGEEAVVGPFSVGTYGRTLRFRLSETDDVSIAVLAT